MTFLELYGEALSLQVGSDKTDSNSLFTVARRKALINEGVREFVRLTECVMRTGSVTLADATGTYAIEATLTDWWALSDLEGVSIAIVSGTTTRYLVEGRDLFRRDKRRLDLERPGWRSADPGTPQVVYLDNVDGRAVLGLWPAPDIIGADTWTASVPYVPHVPDMVADADVPFTVAGAAPKRLRPWHQAPVHYAAHRLEIARKQFDLAREQLGLFTAYVQGYAQAQRTPGGDVVIFAPEARVSIGRGRFSGDPMVDW